MSNSKQPKIKLQREWSDNLLDGLALLGVVLMISIPLVCYSDLPDRIPTHYNIHGEADAFGPKATLWLLPGIGVFLFVFLIALTRIPHHFNFVQKITAENAHKQYRMAVLVMRYLNAVISLGFAYMVWRTVESALGHGGGLGKFFIPAFILATMGGTWFFFFKSTQK